MIVSAPSTLRSDAPALNATAASAGSLAAAPAPVIVLFVSENPWTPAPLMPAWAGSWTRMSFSETPAVSLSEIAWPVADRIVPPLFGAPVPVTTRPPELPVPLRTMPFSAPSAEMLRNVSPANAIVSLRISSAVPVVEASVLAGPVAVTVPPPDAENAGLAPVPATILPLKPTLAPVLTRSSIPVPVSLTAPKNETAPPVRFWTETEWPPVVVTADPIVTVPAPPSSATPPPVPVIAVCAPMVAAPTFVPDTAGAPLAVMSTRWTSAPPASVTAGAPPALTTGLLPAAGTSVVALAVRPRGSPISFWLASRTMPPG